ncbi:putative ribose-5-phosphate isomerase 3, chloroplastic, partial [Curcuma longa]|uniref:putative ribose-5-phosphate isomerase 3, chloroplastic n=1 Tax=Curcuma longa TaxID=136217 RepID=UPI003D9E7BD8
TFQILSPLDSLTDSPCPPPPRSSLRPPPSSTAAARHPGRRPDAAPVRALSAAVALTRDDLEKLAVVKTVEYVSSGMPLDLGTGSTAAFVVAEIGSLLASGKLSDIVGVPTSKRTYEQALALGIPLSTLDHHPRIDLAIDGADQVRS